MLLEWDYDTFIGYPFSKAFFISLIALLDYSKFENLTNPYPLLNKVTGSVIIFEAVTL